MPVTLRFPMLELFFPHPPTPSHTLPPHGEQTSRLSSILTHIQPIRTAPQHFPELLEGSLEAHGTLVSVVPQNTLAPLQERFLLLVLGSRVSLGGMFMLRKHVWECVTGSFLFTWGNSHMLRKPCGLTARASSDLSGLWWLWPS